MYCAAKTKKAAEAAFLTSQPLRALARGREGIEYLDHLRVALGIAGDDLALVQEVRFARVVTDKSACFSNQQAAGRHVPRADALLEEPVEPACSDVSQIQRGRARAAQAGTSFGHLREELAIRVDTLAVAERETRPHERIPEPVQFRPPNP